MSLSDTVVAFALTLDGLSWSSDQDRFSRLLFPHDTDADRLDMARGQYCCATTLRAAMREGGVDGRCVWHGAPVDVLRDPYNTLRIAGCDAVTSLETLARHHKAWQVPKDLSAIQAGWGIVIGGPSGYGGAAHAILVTGRDGDRLETVEGGKTDRQNFGRGTSIQRCARDLVMRGRAEVWIADVTTREARRLYGCFDVDALPAVTS